LNLKRGKVECFEANFELDFILFVERSMRCKKGDRAIESEFEGTVPENSVEQAAWPHRRGIRASYFEVIRTFE
jgi:hypothetical protein